MLALLSYALGKWLLYEPITEITDYRLLDPASGSYYNKLSHVMFISLLSQTQFVNDEDEGCLDPGMMALLLTQRSESSK